MKMGDDFDETSLGATAFLGMYFVILPQFTGFLLRQEQSPENYRKTDRWRHVRASLVAQLKERRSVAAEAAEHGGTTSRRRLRAWVR